MPRSRPSLRRAGFLAAAALAVGVVGTGALPVPALASSGAVTLDDLVHGPWISPGPSATVTGQNASAQNASAQNASASTPTPVPASRAKPRTRPWAFPVRDGTPTSGTFGETGTYWPRGHAGIDFDGDLGDPVFATISGRVIYATFNTGGYGNLVITQRGDGTQVRYAHLDRILVSKGDWVRAGTRVGRMGATGQATGVHLHLEVRVNDGLTPTDPASVWSGKRPGIPARPPAWACANYGGCADQDKRSTGA